MDESSAVGVGRARTRPVDVAVIGAGVVGLGIAWSAALSGRTVRLIDPAPARGATFAAAGMLAPVSELHYQEERLLELTLESAEIYPRFVESLACEGRTSGYQATSTLVLGADAADRRSLSDLRELQLGLGLRVEQLTIRQARSLEPLLSPRLSCAFSVEDDHQVDPRALAACLEAALAAHADREGWPGCLVRQSASRLLHADPADEASAVIGVELEDGTAIRSREVVVANGLAAPQLGGLPATLSLPVRPVYGDVLRLRVPSRMRPMLTATVRGLVQGTPVYIVPREDGTVVVGATQREDGSAAVSAGGVYQLLRDAQVLLPAVAELELIEATARARPGTPDNAPLLGRVAGTSGADIPGLIIATGFYRHGVLLAPIAAQICRQLMDGDTVDAWRRFRPDRFADAPGGSLNAQYHAQR